MHPFDPSETLTIRLAVSDDAQALRRLAQLDSAPTPAPGPGPAPMLIAEVAGELRAAVPAARRPRDRGPLPPDGRARGPSHRADAADRASAASAGPPSDGRRVCGARQSRFAPEAELRIRSPGNRCRSPSICSAGRSRARRPRRGSTARPQSLGAHRLSRPEPRSQPPREHLAELLFAAADDPLGSLRWNLAELRRALGAATLPHGSTELSLAPGTFVDVDALVRATPRRRWPSPGWDAKCWRACSSATRPPSRRGFSLSAAACSAPLRRPSTKPRSTAWQPVRRPRRSASRRGSSR